MTRKWIARDPVQLRKAATVMTNGPTQCREKFLVFGRPSIGKLEIDEVVSSLRSGWLGTGPKVAVFEERFRDFKDGWGHPIAVNSCTAALHLSLLALDLRPGDEIITSALTFCATVNAIAHAGGTPVLTDVEPRSMNMSAEQVEARVTCRTRAIVVVHFAGRPCNMSDLLEVAKRHGLALIEDCAHAVEARYKTQPTGTFGDFGCFSFYSTKNIVTGEGGLILAREKAVAERLRILRLHGLSGDAWKRFSAANYSHYSILDCGFKYNMMDLQAAIGLHQLERVEAFWKCRQRLWQVYDKGLSGLGLELPAPPEDGTVHSLHLYTVLIDEAEVGISRDTFLRSMNDHRIGVGVHYISLPDHEYYRRRFKWRPDDYPEARRIGRTTVTLPLSPAMTERDGRRVISVVQEVVAEAKRSQHIRHLSRAVIPTQRTDAVTASPRHTYQFIIVAPVYRDSSSGVRALHRLCHLLNVANYRAAVRPPVGADPRVATNAAWNTPVFLGTTPPVGSIVIYPEVIRGNPMYAERIVRWALNYPGLFGGDRVYAANELVFVWDARMLHQVRISTRQDLDANRVLCVPVVDPEFIYPDASVKKDVDCYFVYKGHRVRARYRIPDEQDMICIDLSTPSLYHLGQLLRRTRKLYSYDHATMLFHEAIVSGCEIFQVHEDGLIVDPRTCSAEHRPCSLKETTSWPPADFLTSYRKDWDDPAPAVRFVNSLSKIWPL